jgi:hypothetical protein
MPQIPPFRGVTPLSLPMTGLMSLPLFLPNVSFPPLSLLSPPFSSSWPTSSMPTPSPPPAKPVRISTCHAKPLRRPAPRRAPS